MRYLFGGAITGVSAGLGIETARVLAAHISGPGPL
jgi:hypothetical protein